MKKKSANPSVGATNLTIRVSREYRQWLERAAAHCRISVSAFLDVAATHEAKAKGFNDAPPKR